MIQAVLPAGAPVGPPAGHAVAGFLAHGVGGRDDLPVPFFYALAGAVTAVFVSFVAMGLLWATPKFRGDAAGWPLPWRVQAVADSAGCRWTLRAAGLAVTAYVAVAAVFGPDGVRNLTAGFVYVLFWVGLVPASLLFGPVWRRLNPLRTLYVAGAALSGRDPASGRWPLPRWLGYWPAAAGLLAFTWHELVAPYRTSPTFLLAWFGCYGGVQLLGAAAYGSRWFDRCDAFEVYSAFIGRLAPLGRRTDGRHVLRNPFDGLDGLRVAPGLAATVCVMLGSTGYDSLSGAPLWARIVQSGPLPPAVAGTFGLVGAVVLVGVLYAGCVGAAAARTAESARVLVGRFAHSIVPIATGYLVAHYFSLLIFGGQRTLILASDPLGTGANLWGTADMTVNAAAVSPAAIATVQVLAIVTGHVLGVVAAHDRAVRLFPVGQAVAGQIPLLLLMVTYTLGGLVLLFAA